MEWISSADSNIITFSAVGDNPSELKGTLGGAAECLLQWVIRAGPKSAVLAPLWPQEPQLLTSVSPSCGPPVPFPFFPLPEWQRKTSRGWGKCERVGEEQEAESKKVEKLIQVNSRNYGQGTMCLHSGSPSSATCLLCGLGKFSFPSNFSSLTCTVGSIRGDVGENEHGRV